MPPVVAAVATFIGVSVGAVVLTAAVIVGTVILAKLLMPKIPNTNAATLQRLEQTLVVDEFRKYGFGHTAMGNDERYWEAYGTTGYDQVIAGLTHKISSFGTFYVEGVAVTFSGANATGTLVGALSKYNVAQGATGSSGYGVAVGAGSLYSATTASFTGCCSYLLKWTYTTEKLPNGLPSRTLQDGDLALVYDPRRDTTRGGSGSHRADDQTTWEFTPTDSNGKPIGYNNALQMLWHLIGWRITNPSTGEKVLVAGRGVDLNDIDFANFITAANVCESEQYYTHSLHSTGDTHETNEGIIEAGCQGHLLDNGGLWSYYPATDDTASIAVALTDDDVVSGVSWDPRATINEQYNQIGGTFIDPSTTSLYQALPYPVIKDATYLTQDNSMPSRQTLDFQNVQDAALAQKLARIALNRSRLTGQFSATFNRKALKALAFNCVTLSFKPLGFVNKLFRVTSMAIAPNGGVDLVLQEEASSVYTGGSITSYVAPSVGTIYDVRQAIALAGFTATAVDVPSDITHHFDGINLAWTAVSSLVKRVETQYKKTGTSNWSDGASISDKSLNDTVIYPLLPSTSYDVQARTISINDVPGAWVSSTLSTNANTTFTQNQTYYQGTDPALSVTVNDGAIWGDTAHSKLWMRSGGSWVLIGTITVPMSDGDSIFDSSTAGTYSVPIPSTALTHVDIFCFGAGGGSGGVHGGGGGGYARVLTFAVTAGTTVLTIVVGQGGRAADVSSSITATSGTASTCTSSTGSLNLSAGGGANGNSVGGGGGTNTSTSGTGTPTNTTGEAGDTGGVGNGGANLGTGGLGATGGARQTGVGVNGNAPGGGGSSVGDGNTGKRGAVGRVQVFTRT